jgi:hypothetical protein
MIHAETILQTLDQELDSPVELTLFGRAALQLGFENPPADYALSRDVDAVLWLGQAEEMAAGTNFWDAIDQVNRQLADEELYISHLFTEDQVILLPDWLANRQAIAGPWKKLSVFRLGNTDLLLSKLMRDDPVDQEDAAFIVREGHLNKETILRAFGEARVPDVPEIREQFELCKQRLLASINQATNNQS